MVLGPQGVHLCDQVQRGEVRRKISRLGTCPLGRKQANYQEKKRDPHPKKETFHLENYTLQLQIV